MLHSSERGKGKPLLLLHGLFGMGQNLAMVTRPLSDHFHCYQLDLRNHGKSPHFNSMSLSEMAADLREFLDANGLDTVNLLGHSLGGKVAMEFALQYPKSVERLVVADIAPVEYEGGHEGIFSALGRVDLQQVKSRGEVDEILQPYIAEAGVRQFILTNLYRDVDGQYRWRMNLPVLIDCYKDLQAANTSGLVYEGRTLFIKGELSNYIQADYAHEIKQRFPAAEFKIIQQTGHWLHAEKPKVFTQLVKRFLTQ